MQTFITDFNMAQNAKNLDNKRLGKQRIEALQILDCLLAKKSRWKSHPAVKMWKGYEEYLLYSYLTWVIDQWLRRGFKNNKCQDWYLKLQKICKYPGVENIKKPKWLTKEFIESHRSNLIRKNSEYYKSLFPNTKEGLSYIWPIS